MVERICTRCWLHPARPGKTFCKVCDSKRATLYRQTKSKYRGTCSLCGAIVNELKNEFKLCRDCFSKTIMTSHNMSKYKCAKGTDGSLHIQISEVILQRPLEDGEVVHHIDENKSNNQPANLVVLPNIAHSSFHVFLKRYMKRYSGNTPEVERFNILFRFLQVYNYKYFYIGDVYKNTSDTMKSFVTHLLTEKTKK